MSAMIQENFWVLVSKKIAGEATAEECKDLEQYLLQNPEWQYAIQNLYELWKQQAPLDLQKSEDAYLLHINRLSEVLSKEFVDAQLQLHQISELVLYKINKL